ncbi:MAG: winged helix DNA-binding domain-containing protein [Gammaproteobacteria bacterium]|nr:winged helix DNA-binding domain-containing protein [Gammaproteobacteria bacterium]
MYIDNFYDASSVGDSDVIEPKGKATLPISKLRRVALEQQGLLRRAHFGRGKNATLRAIEHLGYVQIDTISVVQRAHHHVLRTRVPNYETAFLDRLQAEAKVFEYWYHAAAYLPMRDYRFALPRMRAMKRHSTEGGAGWVRSRDKQLMDKILDRIRIDGRLRSRDFEDTGGSNAGWWDWKPAKRALEQLFIQGDLMITGRVGFQKSYDLPERVLPSDVNVDEPTTDELAHHVVGNTLRAHGFATLKSFTHGRKGSALRQAVKKCLEDGAVGGRFARFTTANGTLWYGDRSSLEPRAPSTSASVRILSPFDNAVILRHRAQVLFEFDYQIECYVKAEHRRFGYFCLPILYRDRFVGRMDCKAHRQDRHLEIRRLFIEAPVDDGFLQAFTDATWDFAGCNDCVEVSLTSCEPGKLTTQIATSLKAQ